VPLCPVSNVSLVFVDYLDCVSNISCVLIHCVDCISSISCVFIGYIDCVSNISLVFVDYADCVCSSVAKLCGVLVGCRHPRCAAMQRPRHLARHVCLS